MEVGTLGDIVFEVSAFRVATLSGFSMSRGAKFEDHPVQGSFPASEFVAPELGTARLAMTLRHDLGCDPAAEAERLEDKCIAGEVQRLIIAGKNLGRWTIRTVDQEWRHMRRGVVGPLAITINVSLTEYF